MLDLVLFSSCIGIAKFISRPLSSPSAGVGNIHKSPSDHHVEVHSSQTLSTDESPGNTSTMHRVSHIIFQTTLLLSLWLFCLSILEAAPSSWLLIIHQTSSIVQFYRINLWALCTLLEVVIPAVLGVLLVIKLSGYETVASSLAPAPSISPRNKSGRDNNRILLLFHLVWIVIRFVFVATWFIIRRILSIFLPKAFLGGNQSSAASIRGNACIDNNRLKQYCSAKIVLPVLFALTISFWMLGTLSTIVMLDTRNPYTEGDTISDNTKHKHRLGQYCLWIIGPHSPLKFMVKMACALGMIIASLLNGFGCASMPHSNLVGMYLKPTPAAVLTKVEEDYDYAVQNLEEKRYMLFGLLQLSSSANVPADNIKIKNLKEEVVFLENLVGDMGDDIEEMKYSQKLALKARTAVGYISWVLGLVFSIILMVRVALAASSFIHVSRVNRSIPTERRDPITMIVLWLTGHDIVSDEQYNLYLQGTSLVLAGFLTVSQVRAFFRVIGALGRKLSQLFGVSIDATKQKGVGDLSLLFSSFVMGCYFLSCVVVVKMTLPIEYRSSFAAAVGEFDFGFNSALLNIIFCISACGSAIVLSFLFGIQRSNSERYESALTSKGSFSHDDSATHTA
jgi:hypothetical protein